jgi:trehalose/maltose hydrolase-like predicted phosphorylase
VIGPDEYHEGVDDNAYTNIMAQWNVSRALEICAWMREHWPARWSELSQEIGLNAAELAHWDDVARTLETGFDRATGLIEQFAGFFALEPVDLARYPDRTVPMDVQLGRAVTARSQVVKQADVVALLALLPNVFDRATRLTNFRFYESRCSHGSSLSRSMHAFVAARLGEDALALRYLIESATIDLAPHAAESAGGVHIAALGGLWQAVVMGFGGVSLAGEWLSLEPRLPPHWRSLGFAVCWRGRRVRIRIEAEGTVETTLESGEPMTMLVQGVERALNRSA